MNQVQWIILDYLLTDKEGNALKAIINPKEDKYHSLQ